MNGKPNKLRILSFVGCVVIVLPAFLCGCGESKEDKAKAYFDEGEIYMKVNEYVDAIVAYEKAVAIKPDFALAYYNLGGAYGKLKNYTHAIASYKKAIAIKPEDASAYCGMGRAYHELKQYPEALSTYEKCIAIKADYGEAYYWMGRAYHKLKQYPEALSAYEKCITVEPTGSWANPARMEIGPRGRPVLLNNKQIEEYIEVTLIMDNNPIEARIALDKAIEELDRTHKVDYLSRTIYWFKLAQAYGKVLNTRDETKFISAKRRLTNLVQEKYRNAYAYQRDHKYNTANFIFRELLDMLPSMGPRDEQNELRKNIIDQVAYIRRLVAKNKVTSSIP